MGRNEIRLRRQLMSSGRIARHRNYSELMRQHDKEMRLKRVLRVFTYFLIILFLLILLLIVIRWESKQRSEPTSNKMTKKNFVTLQQAYDQVITKQVISMNQIKVAAAVSLLAN